MCQIVMAELEQEGIPYEKNVPLGIMIETPAAVFISDRLAHECDFFSIGTNDLLQYTTACDRQTSGMSRFYDPHHPALLRAIKMVVDSAHAAGIWVGVCGELASDLSMVQTLLALGVDELSVSPGSVLEVLLTAIARNMIVGHGDALQNLISVGAIALIFIIRRYLYVPAFGHALPSGEQEPQAETAEVH